MILDNANVVTLDPRMPHARALAIAGGKILGGVDSREDAIASQAHEHIDLQGATVVPGFVDAHVHFRSWAKARMRLDLRAIHRLDALSDAISARVAANQPGDPTSQPAWVLGGGLREDLLAHPDLSSAVDRAVGSMLPVALIAKDGHGAFVNAHGLTVLGARAEDFVCAGGIVERTASGAFSGVLRERASWLLRARLPETDLDIQAMARAMRAAVARGVTGVHDMDGSAGFASWQSLAAERGLSLRVWQNLLADDLEHAAALGIRPGFGTERLRIGGIKVFCDGTLSAGTAWLHEPEESGASTGCEDKSVSAADMPTRSPTQITPPAELERIARAAGKAGFPLLVHAIGDAAATAVIDALAETFSAWSEIGLPPRIEHAQLIGELDLARCVELGIALSVQPTHLLTDAAVATRRWGAERCMHAYAYRSMIDAGALVAFGSDAPIEDLDPLAAIRAACWRAETPSADDAWHPEQRVTALAALNATCTAPALLTGRGAVQGTLTSGKDADLVVLSGDPLRDPLDSVDVVATMVGGRWVHGRTSLGR